jgi:hypothetical protein
VCGIVGIVSLDGEPIDVATLQRMNDLQTHRGPEGEGFLLGSLDAGKSEYAFVRRIAQWDSKAGSQMALGHRRLAILDLSERGLQPMTVDYSDLFAHADPSITAYNFLSMEAAKWCRHNVDRHFQNRLRHSDCARLFEVAAFQIVTQEAHASAGMEESPRALTHRARISRIRSFVSRRRKWLLYVYAGVAISHGRSLAAT